MKSLKHYLMESARSYHYTIKIAGEVPKEFLELFKYNLNKFAPIEIGEFTTTPIQKDPYGFSHMQNVPVNIVKVKFKYPTTEPMIKQVVQLLGFKVDTNCVRVIQSEYNDSINTEQQQYQNQPSPVLGSETHVDPDASPKAASKAYSNQYLDSIKKQSSAHRPELAYAAKPTAINNDAFTQAKLDKRSTTSPMTNVKRPGRPKTNAGR